MIPVELLIVAPLLLIVVVGGVVGIVAGRMITRWRKGR